MRTLRIPAALLTFVFFASALLFSQSSNGTISGTVADATGAVVPGVTVTATNNATGVVTTVQSKDLPLVSNNVLDLVAVMGGTFLTNDKVFGAEQTNFAGVSARDVNISRDGISVSNQRWPNGLETPTKMNPDLVGEIRMILAPVDAEMGRGNGQIQILTRSGTNEYRGSATWNIQNTALDANTWLNNSRRVTPPWRNGHDYSLAFGGPIKKNKTFFYTVWNQLIVESRTEVFPNVLTDCARRGIFRYYDNYINGNARQLTTTVGGFPTTATVNPDGSPKSTDGSPLRYLNLFVSLTVTSQESV